MPRRTRRTHSPSFKAKAALAALTLCMLATTGAERSHAQQRPGSMAAGVQLGAPGGVSFKRYLKPRFAYEGLAAWNFNNFFFLSGHALRERAIPDSPLGYYYGPGVAAGVQKEVSQSDFVLGVSGTFGVHFFANRYEVFLQVNPRLNLLPGTTGHFGGGIGVRYYFRE